jgi:hypothetical protein
MKLTANITLDELTKSQVAERKGINNNPNPAQIENLKELAVNILQPVRSHFDKPLIISSGFDQLILEFYRDNEPTSGWIHCSYSSNSNRNQSLRAFREEGKVVYKPWLE